MYQVVVSLLDPFLLLFLATTCAIANLWRKRRETSARLWFVTASFAGLVVVCTPAVGHMALGSLEWAYPPRTRRPPNVEAALNPNYGATPETVVAWRRTFITTARPAWSPSPADRMTRSQPVPVSPRP
jgi:hypothetical protein